MAVKSRKEAHDLIDEIIRAYNKWNDLVKRDCSYKGTKTICDVSDEQREAYIKYHELKEKLVDMIPIHDEKGDVDDFIYNYGDIRRARGYEIKVDDLGLL